MPQDILITPTSGIPQILFRGSGTTDTAIELNVLSSYQSATGSGTALVFEGTQGQLFAITDNLSSGTIFSVGDITGLPQFEIDSSGTMYLAEYGSNIRAFRPLELVASGTGSGQTNQLRFQELVANGSNYVALKAPDSISSNTVWTLPSGDGTLNQALTTNGSGTLRWSNIIGAVDGSGTQDYVARWIDSDTLASGQIIDNGSTLGIGQILSSGKLHVYTNVGQNLSPITAWNAGAGSTTIVPNFIGYSAAGIETARITNGGLYLGNGIRSLAQDVRIGLGAGRADLTGNLWLSSFGGEILFRSPDGTKTKTISLSNDATFNIAVGTSADGWGNNNVAFAIKTPAGANRTTIGNFGNLAIGMTSPNGGTNWDSTNLFSANVEQISNFTGKLALFSVSSLEKASINADGSMFLAESYTDSNNYERLALKRGSYSTKSHFIIAAETSGTGGDNIDLVLRPAGNGAFIVGPPPDGTTVGGNARGEYAIDIQTWRDNAARVASGNNSIAIGHSCQASTTESIAIGYGSIASGSGGSISLGVGNSTSSGFLSVAIGRDCEATGTGGGTVAIGLRTKADRSSMFSFAGGKFVNNGDAQFAMMVGRIKTTNALPTEILLGPDANQKISIPSGKILSFLVNIAGVKSDGSASCHFIRQYSIKNVGGTTSEVYAPVTVGSDFPSGCDVILSADNTNDALKLEVVGIAGETWRWTAVIHGVDIEYGT